MSRLARQPGYLGRREHADCGEAGRADLKTRATPDALVLVNGVYLCLAARYRLRRAPSQADHAGAALLGIDVIGHCRAEKPLDVVGGVEIAVGRDRGRA